MDWQDGVLYAVQVAKGEVQIYRLGAKGLAASTG